MAKVLFKSGSGQSRPRVVVIGGGTGLSVILKELKNENMAITAIVAVADDGGSSGKLRQITKSIPPGDLRNVLCALSGLPKEYVDILQYRFKEGNDVLSGHPLGNLIVASMAEREGNYYQAIKKLSSMMKVKSKVLASSEVPLTLVAHFKDGTVVEGESAIPKERKLIDYVTIRPTHEGDVIQAGPEVSESIEEADLIVLGPGSLYTSILPNLLIDSVAAAVLASKAKKIYISNIMTQKGETENFSDADHVKVLHQHIGAKFIDIVLVNNEKLPEAYANLPGQDENLRQVSHDFHALKAEVPTIVSDNFLRLTDQGIYHDGRKIAQEIYNQALDYQRIVRFSM